MPGILALVLCLAGPSGAGAQLDPATLFPTFAAAEMPATPPTAAWHPVASLAVPGLGQLLQERPVGAALFAAAELGGIWIWARASSDGAGLRDRYRDLAWGVARSNRGPRVVDDFDYYERMGFFQRSGRFDADPTRAGIQPERDPSTWNGLQWSLAARVHLQGDPDAGPEHPGYDAALERYSERAYGEELVWDWSGAPGARERYRDLISDSDDRFRTAGIVAGALLANHIAAGVEAFVVRRTRLNRIDMRVAPEATGRTHLRIRIHP